MLTQPGYASSGGQFVGDRDRLYPLRHLRGSAELHVHRQDLRQEEGRQPNDVIGADPWHSFLGQALPPGNTHPLLRMTSG